MEIRRGQASRGRAPRSGLDAWLACGFLTLCYALGGSSRFQLVPHLVLRLVSIVAIGVALVRMSPTDRARTRPFALSLLVFGGLMAAQLIPLPPGLWAALPGHGFYNDALRSVGLADRWRPWSMSPDLTLNSLFALLPALAGVMLFAPLNATDRRLLLNAVLLLLVAGALLSVLQVVSGGFSLYEKGQDVGAGVFTNRNHQALFLAVGIIVILGRWRAGRRREDDPVRMAIVLGSVVAIFPLLIVGGSRAGLVAGILAFLAGGLVFTRGLITKRTGWRRFALPAVALLLVSVAFGLGMASSRQLAVQRLLQTGSTITTTELRTANLPAVIEMEKAFFPFGSGFGTFDAVFRRFESNAMLRPSYYNHAHSDPIELLIEGGIFSAVIMVIGLIWFARRSVALITGSARSYDIMAQIGVLGLAILLFGSIADYPMRTPFLGMLAVLFVTWIDGAGVDRAGEAALARRSP